MARAASNDASRMHVYRFPSRRLMGDAAAIAVAGELRKRLNRQDNVRMIFAAAPSQAEMLSALVAAPDIEWPRVTAFHMDEYIGLDKKHPASFATWLDRHLFTFVPFGRIHRIEPEPKPEAAARAYAERLAESPIDIVCLGIGVNGHIAFNDPPVADFKDPLAVKLVALDETCRQQQVDDGCFPTRDAVPTHAVTLTVPRLLDADRLFCVVPGPAKRDAVRQTLNGPITTACPASVLRTHPDCSLYLDADSDPDG